ncbi:MAG: amidase [Acidobacteria bacterium]|uniref:Amidase n=1 Tax=Candidatus Polarisedimenticola svalbardensis TaxID=2886004 RepID=A0A8J6Y3T3_9BACT|nr:amidase [Candidatus Polarisedimenticola svalbardensis]
MSSDSGLSRRTFIGLTAAGGAALLVGQLGCRKGESPAGEDGAAESAGDAFEFYEITLAQLQAGMESGRWTSRQITDAHLARIEAIDRQGPMLRAVIETNPDAGAIADEMDRERKEQHVRGPLHGIPVLLKDNIGTADKMTTTAGSLALEGSIPTEDSTVARLLREAGAVLLGKTNLSEWANFRSTNSSSGWSARGGQCRNPYALDRNPCGSSSGSAVAVSASLAPLAVGTETDGSVVCPSSINGIVGIKPTVGLAGRTGIIPISHTQDTAGPMARTVRDAAILLGAMAGVDPADGATAAAADRGHTDYTGFLTPDGLKGARIGIGRQFFGFHKGVDTCMEEAIGALSRAGAVIVDPADIETRNQFGDAEFEVLLYEFKDGLNRYFQSLGPTASIRSLKALIDFNSRNADREMPYFGQEILEMAEAKGDLKSREYLEALETCRSLSRDKGIDAVMDKLNLDAILAPSNGPAWMTDHVNGDHYGGGSSSPAAVSGYPNITVPAGEVGGLPVGVSFFGRAWSEPVLLRIAYGFEQVTGQRMAPRLLPTLEIG